MDKPKKMSQNIFQYATSELSQDAFISLIIAWFDSENKELKKISEDFINALHNEYFGSAKVLEIAGIEIKQQHYKIDVYFEVTCKNGEKIPFIIEDKTWTEPHSNQLERYVTKVAEKLGMVKNKGKIVKIFYKTGHLTEKDICDTGNKTFSEKSIEGHYCESVPYCYKIIDTKWMWEFMSIHKVDHYIFNDYYEFLEENFYRKMYDEDTGQKKRLQDWEYNDLKEGFVQYAVIEQIKSNLLKQGIANDKNRIRYTRNGKMWNTWWTFYEEDHCIFFCKIAKIKQTYRIRLIEYSRSTTANKIKTLNDNIEISRKILETRRHDKIRYIQKANYKVRESEIASIDLNNGVSLVENTQTFSNFLKDFLNAKKKPDSCRHIPSTQPAILLPSKTKGVKNGTSKMSGLWVARVCRLALSRLWRYTVHQSWVQGDDEQRHICSRQLPSGRLPSLQEQKC